MKRLIIQIGLTIAIAALIGCAAKPIVKGDSELQHKKATFPKIGQQIHVVTGGLVHLHTDYRSRFAYRLSQPLSIRFTLGWIKVTKDDVLFEASLEGQDVFCTVRNVYYDLLIGLVGPTRNACFVQSEKGKFNKVKAHPGEYWFTKEIDPAIDYIGSEVPFIADGKPFKRELIFEGSQNGNIFFTERLYEMSLDAPSKAKPLFAKIDSIPTEIFLDGAVLNVTSFTSNSLTYNLIKSWE